VLLKSKRRPGRIWCGTKQGLAALSKKDGNWRKEYRFEHIDQTIWSIAEDKQGNLWLRTLTGHVLKVEYPNDLARSAVTTYDTSHGLPDGETYVAEAAGHVLFAASKGLYRFDGKTKSFIPDPVLGDQFAGGARPVFRIAEGKNKHIWFHSKSRNYQAIPQPDWSTWNKETTKYYTNLDSGLYNFRVQAKNIYENLSKEAVFQFKILLPWYRTWRAFLLYAAALFLLIFFIVKWRRSIQLEKEKQKLEQTVKDRTKELKEKNLQLEEQAEKLEEMDKVKSRFFANISHEFRTPLTLIMGPLEQMLSADHENEKERKKKLNLMLRNSQRLLSLINQLLDLTRFDSGKMTLQAAYRNIVPFLKGIPASFHTLARQNQLDLEFNPEEAEISLYFDAHKMEEVMYNLLINAVKFTPPGGKITISIVKEKPGPAKESQGPDDYIKISVKDTGIGISQEQIIHIFDRFYQAENSKDKNQTGTGIGLALTKEIVLLHHGIIDVHSREGKGTEFEIRLPMGKEHLKSNEIVTTSEIPPRPQKEKELETLYVKQEEQEGEGAEVKNDMAHEDKTPEQEKNVILVVEDHAEVRKYIRDPLDPDYTVVEACDGREGITKAKEIINPHLLSKPMAWVTYRRFAPLKASLTEPNR
jgi:signal transduction histidine kinase